MILVRRANKRDIDSIATLMGELNLYRKEIFSTKNKEFHERIKPYLPIETSDFDKSIFFIAIDDEDEIIGFIQGSIDQRKNHKLDKLGYIDELYVKDDFRGKGAAKNLFTNLESEFKAQGCNHLIAHTDVENNLSKEFYLQSSMGETTIELWKRI